MSEAFSGKSGKPCLLLIDDVPTNLRALVDMLADTCDLQFATSGAQALALLQSPPLPDLILLDIMMPDMDGYAVCRELKRQAATQHIPVIFVTALDEATDEILGFEVGAADYITKPFDADVVLARVRNQLRLKFAFDSLRESAAGHDGREAQNVFRSNGASWDICFRGRLHFQLKDMLGLAYLQRLIAHPERYFSVEEVVFLSVPKEQEAILARAAPRMDRQSLQHFRLLADGIVTRRQQQTGFYSARDSLASSMEWLLGELHRVGVLGSDAALAIDDRERYRKSVGNAIRRAVREIGEHDLTLSSHLQFPNLRLGYELVYAPQPAVFWQV